MLSMNEKNQKSSFYDLNPDLVLQATENAGYQPTGEFTQLNSYENRVFEVRIEAQSPSSPNSVIAKFYRPGRWNPAAILEEHDFLQELSKEDLNVGQALKQKGTPPNSPTLSQISGLSVAFFEKIRGRMSTEFFLPDLELVGKKLAHLHNVGARKRFKHRPILAEEPLNPYEILDQLLPHVAQEVRGRYEQAVENLLEQMLEHVDPNCFQRIQGDCHRGNILHNGKIDKESDFYFVDFDDSMMGPVVQDIWLLFSATQSDADWLHQEQDSLLKGYEQFRHFPREQLDWIPYLRGLRIFQYAAWISSRWSDPSFPKIFPQFGTFNYWAEETEALEKSLRGI